MPRNICCESLATKVYRSHGFRELTRFDYSAAPDAAARLAVLVANRDEIVADCKDLLDFCTDPDVLDQAGLATGAIEAFKAGHHQAAMALCVALGEPLAVWASTPRVRGFDTHADRDAWE